MSVMSVVAKEKAILMASMYRGGVTVVKCTPESQVANVEYHQTEGDSMLNLHTGLSNGVTHALHAHSIL